MIIQLFKSKPLNCTLIRGEFYRYELYLNKAIKKYLQSFLVERKIKSFHIVQIVKMKFHGQ